MYARNTCDRKIIWKKYVDPSPITWPLLGAPAPLTLLFFTTLSHMLTFECGALYLGRGLRPTQVIGQLKQSANHSSAAPPIPAGQNWGRTPQAIQDLAATLEKGQSDPKIDYVAIEHDLDDLLQMLPPAQCFEWEDPSAVVGQTQRKGPTVIQPLDIGVAKGHKRTVVERCEAVLQPDL
ncbi:hypothetical protein Y032_0074g880 [Ancylostoma ceylanicum]|uniref:Uncharacterized protein n=1 Tax=Ancylostoma ceylanicum TaxID=53326 RepID=A0A016TVH5_9BILA|nr:hypothetical protein Y032_0074g880 [Ancylostoma ceylanicum]